MRDNSGMDSDAPRCERCNRSMETGFLIDHGHGAAYPGAWVAGIAKWSRWLGLQVRREQKMPVTTYRCPECGVLQSFARPGKWPA